MLPCAVTVLVNHQISRRLRGAEVVPVQEAVAAAGAVVRPRSITSMIGSPISAAPASARHFLNAHVHARVSRTDVSDAGIGHRNDLQAGAVNDPHIHATNT